MKTKALIILFCMLTSSLNAQVWDGTVAESYAGGNGTKDNPYQISNGNELAKLAYDVRNKYKFSRGKYFRLTADIVMAENVMAADEETLRHGKAFTQTPMIGEYSNDEDYRAFMGDFDGCGHSISGVYIVEYTAYIALFRIVEGATIRNLTIRDSYIYNNVYAGGLVSLMLDSRLLNCSVVNSRISGYGSYEGGLVGQMFGSSKIQNCFSSADINGKNNVGGICGRVGNGDAQSCLIENCFSASNITTFKSKKGGIVAENSHGSTVRNCFFLATTVDDAIDSNNGASENNVAKSRDEMLSADVVSELNANAKEIEGARRWTKNLGFE